MMIKKLVLTLVVLTSSLVVSAQVKMAEVFRTMPDSIVRLLTDNDRMDLLDFAESNMTARVTNRLDGKSTLNILTDDYLHLTVTTMSSLQMRLFPLNDGRQAVVVVKTVAGPAKDSVLKIYTSDWSEQLEVEPHVTAPSLDAYWTKPFDEMTEEELQVVRQLDPVLIQISLSAERNGILFQRSFGMLAKADQPQAEKLLRSIEVSWK